MTKKLKRHLESRLLPLYLASLGVVLGSPSLFLGWQTDDYVHRGALVGVPEIPEVSRSPFELFAFLRGEVDYNRRLMEMGLLPWWSDPELKLAFFRPVTGITHWFDYQIFPETPLLMHLHNLFWLGAFIAAATLLYRRFLLPPWVAGFAALLFAIDDAHGMPAVWIANRNSLIGGFFGLLTILFHDRWRRDEWTPGAALSAFALLLGLLSNEGTVAVGAYLFGYALFLEEDAWRNRAASVLPSLTVAILWYLSYRLMGYGAAHSQMYLEPGEDPLRYLRAILERGPLLLFGQWAFPADIDLFLSAEAKKVFWALTVGWVLFLTFLLFPLLKKDRVARFFAFGMVLSVVPVCATMPGDRLLFFVGLGGMGLLAQFLSACRAGVEWIPNTSVWRAPARVAWGLFLLVHLVLTPVSLLTTSAKVGAFGDTMVAAATSLPAEEGIRERVVIAVNAPTAFLVTSAPLIQYWEGNPAPERIRILATGLGDLEVDRTDDRTLVMRPEGGYFAPPGTLAGDPPASPMYSFTPFDGLYFAGGPFEAGTVIDLSDPVVTIEEITPDGRPGAVSFRFERPLEDDSYRWVKWVDGVYTAFDLPTVGESEVLPRVTVSF